MKKIIVFIILFCFIAAPARSADVWGDLNVWGVLKAGGTNERLTFDNTMYFDGTTLGYMLFWGVDTDIKFSLDTTNNTVSGPEIYSETDAVIGFRDGADFLGTTNHRGLTTVVEQDITANFNMEVTTSSAIGVIEKEDERWLHDYTIGGISTGKNIFLGYLSGAPLSMTASTPTPLSTDASQNVGVGAYTLNNLTTGYRNLAIGFNCLYSVTTGYDNCAMGSNALYKNTTGFYNTAVGRSSSREITTGERNSSIGFFSLYNTVLGSDNTAIGSNALRYNVNYDNNTAVGASAGRYYTGDLNLILPQRSTFLGAYTKAKGLASDNEIVIGFDAVGNGDDTATLGNDSIIATYLKGDLLSQKGATGTCTSTIMTVGTSCAGTEIGEDVGTSANKICVVCD